MILPGFFFWLGIANNVALITTFIIRGLNLSIIERFGWIYLLFAIPAAVGLILALQTPGSMQYIVFLLIFLAFLVIEALFDWVWKIPFRESMDWRALVPYVALYVSSNYGFIVMSWRVSSIQGIAMLVLFVVQIGANLLTHPRMG